MMRGLCRARVLWMLAVVPVLAAADLAPLQLEVRPDRATVGDLLELRLTIPGDQAPRQEKLGPDLGPFRVIDERWSQESDAGASHWVWSARVAAFSTGTLEIPALHVAAADSNQGPGWDTAPLVVEIASVLAQDDAAEGEPELADLKGPASVEADLATLWGAAIVVALLAGLAALAWWLNRRYAARLAAAPIVEDPFARTPAHEWAFAALKDLLDRHADYPDDRFYARLSWILKRYLGGRFRIDLLEHTTDETPALLEQAGAAATAVARIVAVLTECDAVKFAKRRPNESQRKGIVERVYGIIDQTKPEERKLDVAAGAA